MAEAIHGGCIDPVDALIESVANGGDGFAVILRAPSKSPIATTDGPRADAERRNLKIAIPELLSLHARLLSNISRPDVVEHVRQSVTGFRDLAFHLSLIHISEPTRLGMISY